MASSQSIPPFPDHLDRDYFGAWFSGLVAGEGCFLLMADRRKVRHAEFFAFHAKLNIKLRMDDVEVLRLAQSYFRCGRIGRVDRDGDNPQAEFKVNVARDLVEIIIPHFDRFPVLAKKQRDYELWKRGVDLLYRVSLRPRQPKRGKGGAGSIKKWTAAEQDEFRSLISAMRETRQFRMPPLPVPESRRRPEPPPQLLLFGS